MRGWRRFLLRAVPLSALLAVLLLLVPLGTLLPLVLGAGMGALVLGFLVVRRLEDLAQEADELEQENARLVAEVEARDPALAERESLGKALARLVRRDEARTRETAVLGHELRNPLAGVTGVARLLSETALTPEQGTYVRAILGATGAMAKLTDDLVAAVSRGSEAAGEQGPSPVRLGALVGDIAELLAPGAHAKGLDIGAFVSPDLPRMLLLDERRLRQVLLNLLGNAIKYTDEGGVGVTATRLPADAGAPQGQRAPRLVLAIVDSGVGIEAAERARMFEAFARAPGTQDREGAGLGLALVSRLVAEMHGTIALEGGPEGRGTRIAVSLPLEEAPAGGPMPPQDLAGLRVRLEADRPITTPLLARSLAVRGADVLAPGFEDAGAVALHDLTTRAPDAFADDPQTWGAASRHVAILRPDQRRHLDALRTAGIDGYLIAPVRPRSLVAQITARHPGTSPARHPAGDAATEPADGPARASTRHLGGTARSPNGRRALLVEDDAVNGLVATRLLETTGWRVSWEADGAEALRRAEAAEAEGHPYALVVTDLDLPGLDGPALIAALLERPKAPRILVATGDAGSTRAADARLAGVIEVLQKPLTRAALEDALAL